VKINEWVKAVIIALRNPTNCSENICYDTRWFSVGTTTGRYNTD